MAPSFSTGLVKVFERSAGQFELTCRFEAYGPVVAAHGDDLAAFFDRLPAELPQTQEDIPNTSGLVI